MQHGESESHEGRKENIILTEKLHFTLRTHHQYRADRIQVVVVTAAKGASPRFGYLYINRFSVKR